MTLIANNDHNVKQTATLLLTRRKCAITIGCRRGLRTTRRIVGLVARTNNGTFILRTSVDSRGRIITVFATVSRRSRPLTTLIGGTKVLFARYAIRGLATRQVGQMLSAGIAKCFLYYHRTMGHVTLGGNNDNNTVIGISSITSQLNSPKRCISCTTSGKTVSALAAKLSLRITTRKVHIGYIQPKFVCARVRTDNNRPKHISHIGSGVPVRHNKRTRRITRTVI